MQREEKLLESALDAISQRINDLKSSIYSLISKLQDDPHVNWPSVLDSFALISGQVLSFFVHFDFQNFRLFTNDELNFCYKLSLKI